MTSSHLSMAIGLAICLACFIATTAGYDLSPAQSADKADHGKAQQKAAASGLKTANSDGKEHIPHRQELEFTNTDSTTSKNGGREHKEMLKATVRDQEEAIKLLQDTVQQQKSVIQYTSQQVDDLRRLVSSLPNGLANAAITGVNYVRWGRTVCEGTAILLYTGYAAGGGGTRGETNPICLIDNPATGNTTGDSTVNVRAVEYMFYSDPFSAANSGSAGDLMHENAPCVLCHVLDRSETFMLPGHSSCPTGWTAEYSGFLASSYYYYIASSPFMCLDDAPEIVSGAGADDVAFEVYAAAPDCTSLPCPPYKADQCVPCAVCTR